MFIRSNYNLNLMGTLNPKEVTTGYPRGSASNQSMSMRGS